MQEPMYIQIHNKLKKDIEEGHKWNVGERIPAERQLAMTFKVSRMTLRQAIQTLEDEGILERRLGSGTYVASQKVQEKMTGVTSFTDMMISQGKRPSSQMISYRIAKPSLSEKEKLDLGDNDQVLRMERVRYGDGIPISFEIATVPQSIVKGFTKEEIGTSLYHTLEKKGKYRFSRAIQKIGASIANERAAKLLNIKKGDPLVSLHQLSFLEDDEPFEYVRAQYVAERFEFYFER